MTDVISIIEMIVGLVVTVFCLGAIPFGATIVKKLAAIETTLETMRWQETAIREMRESEAQIKTRLALVEQRIGS